MVLAWKRVIGRMQHPPRGLKELERFLLMSPKMHLLFWDSTLKNFTVKHAGKTYGTLWGQSAILKATLSNYP